MSRSCQENPHYHPLDSATSQQPASPFGKRLRKSASKMMLSLRGKASFTAIPREFVNLDYLSDGQFRVLILLCMHADADTGECEVKQRTLGSMMSKSKAAISAHVKVLREAGLIETNEQLNTYGGNHILRYSIPFWPAWQAHLRKGKTAKVVQQVERPVHQAERHKESNQILPNHTPYPLQAQASEPAAPQSSPQIEKVVNRMVEEWSEAVGRGNNFPAFDHRPSPALYEQTKRLLDKHRPPSTDAATIAPAIKGRLRDIWQSLRVSVAPDDLAAQAQSVVKSTPDPLPLLGQLAQCIRAAWPKHHRRAPPLEKFAAYVSQARKAQQKAGHSLDTKLHKLASDIKRYHAAFGQPPLTM